MANIDDIPMLIEVPEKTTDSSSIPDSSISVPVTIVTGFLGSGKTTLVMNLLNQNHGKKIAVILNEFGESGGIDKSLLKNDEGVLCEEWLELNNGCLCCSVKDSGVAAIEKLLKSNGKFDCILLETTGLADPGPIASMFWLDDELQSNVYLDGIITVVDSKYIMQYLDEQKPDASINEATRQIALADRIIINKKDLVSNDELAAISNRIQIINASALITKTTRSQIQPEFIFDLHSFDDKEKDPFTGIFKNSQQTYNSTHQIDKSVTTRAFTFHGKVDLEAVDKWLQILLWEKSLQNLTNPSSTEAIEVLRVKMLLDAKDSDYKIIFQAVKELYDKQQGAAWGEEDRLNKLVFIGKNIGNLDLMESFKNSCVL
jgi:G3E family GTPase